MINICGNKYAALSGRKNGTIHIFTPRPQGVAVGLG